MSAVNDLVVASGSVKNKRLFIRNRKTFDEAIARMDERWVLEVTVQRRRATRSLQQSRWYWGVIIQLIAEHTGYTADEVHDICKAQFLQKRLAVQNGNGEVQGEFVIGGSTRRLNKLEFGEYCERIRQWAAETLDVSIPDPDEGSL